MPNSQKIERAHEEIGLAFYFSTLTKKIWNLNKEAEEHEYVKSKANFLHLESENTQMGISSRYSQHIFFFFFYFLHEGTMAEIHLDKRIVIWDLQFTSSSG